MPSLAEDTSKFEIRLNVQPESCCVKISNEFFFLAKTSSIRIDMLPFVNSRVVLDLKKGVPISPTPSSAIQHSTA